MSHRLARVPDLDPALRVEDRSFLGADDVASFVESGGLAVGANSCESWHLDPAGAFICGTVGTALDSLSAWADDPARLVRAFLDGRRTGTCSPRWVIVDRRSGPSGEAPTEADVEHFVRLRAQLEVAGLGLLDAVIFDEHARWWSIHELLTGSLCWPVRQRESIRADALPGE